MNDKKISFDYVKCSKRIRELRLSKGLSHEELGKEIGVSSQVLKNYEQAAIYGTTTGQDRTRTVAGMSINTLCKIAQYFEVPTDYLLGRTDYKCLCENNRISAMTTGLSENAILKLREFNSSEFGTFFPYIISELLESDSVLNLVCSLHSIHSLRSTLLRYCDEVEAKNFSFIDEFGSRFGIFDKVFTSLQLSKFNATESLSDITDEMFDFKSLYNRCLRCREELYRDDDPSRIEGQE